MPKKFRVDSYPSGAPPERDSLGAAAGRGAKTGRSSNRGLSEVGLHGKQGAHDPILGVVPRNRSALFNLPRLRRKVTSTLDDASFSSLVVEGHSHGRLQRGDEREEDVGIVRIGVPEEIGKALRRPLPTSPWPGRACRSAVVRPWS